MAATDVNVSMTYINRRLPEAMSKYPGDFGQATQCGTVCRHSSGVSRGARPRQRGRSALGRGRSPCWSWVLISAESFRRYLFYRYRERPQGGSVLFTAEDRFTNETEVILVHCEDDPGVETWVDNCSHESQRLGRGDGGARRGGELIYPKHGSLFDACSSDCDNGEAACTTLRAVEITVEDGTVHLTDKNYSFLHEGGTDDGPSSSSHLSL